MAFQRKKPAAIGVKVSGIHRTCTGNVDRESAERRALDSRDQVRRLTASKPISGMPPPNFYLSRK
jgi:hypothetical protein